MPKKHRSPISGFIDPISLIAVGALLVSLVVGAAVINKNGINFNPNEEAYSSPCAAPNSCKSSCPTGYSRTGSCNTGICCYTPATSTPHPNCTSPNSCYASCPAGYVSKTGNCNTGICCGRAVKTPTPKPSTSPSPSKSPTLKPSSSPTPTPTSNLPPPCDSGLYCNSYYTPIGSSIYCTSAGIPTHCCAAGKIIANNTCVSPTPSPTPSCSGTCYYGYSACSSLGRQNGNGVCTGGLCCGNLLTDNCTQGFSYCVDSDTVAVCKTDKSGYNTADCATGYICDSTQKKCVLKPTVKPTGTSTPVICAKTGEACSAKKQCCSSSDSCKYVFPNGIICKTTAAPTPPSTPEICAKTGENCGNRLCCNSGEVCESLYGGKYCIQKGSCTIGQVKCQSEGIKSYVYACDANGYYQKTKACDAGCDGNSCKHACIPNVKRCNGDELEICNSDGTAWVGESCSYGCGYVLGQPVCRKNSTPTPKTTTKPTSIPKPTSTSTPISTSIPISCAKSGEACSAKKQCCNPSDSCKYIFPSGYICKTPATPTPPTFSYYSQRDPQWEGAYFTCPDGTIVPFNKQGCGETVTAMILSTYVDSNYTPASVKNKYFSDPNYCKGANIIAVNDVLAENGLTIEKEPSIDTLKNSLLNGDVAIVNIKFWNGSEYVLHHTLATGVDGNGNLIFMDPWFGPNTNLKDINYEITNSEIVKKPRNI